MSVVPERGDLIYLNFNPQVGHEQAGHRPAIVLSPKRFNEVTGFASVCPITNVAKGWGYEVPLPNESVFTGVILTDQVKNLDWRARNISIRGKAGEKTVQDCLERIATYLGE